MPYLHILPFVISEKYGKGEMSQVVIFVYLYYLFAFLIVGTEGGPYSSRSPLLVISPLTCPLVAPAC